MTGEWSATVQVLGGFAVCGVHLRTPSGVQSDLVKQLAVLGPLHVEQAIELLWPDSDVQSGRTRLRNVLARVRRSCGELVQRDGEQLRLHADALVDAEEFRRAADRVLTSDVPLSPAARDAGMAALESAGSELLPLDRYRDWTAVPRERYRRRRLALLDRLAADADHAGFRARASQLVEEAMELDPYDEDRYLVAARLLAARDRRGAALSMLQRARAAMEDLGVGPSAAYFELAGSIGVAEAV